MCFHSRSAIISAILLSSVLLTPVTAQSLDYVLKQSYVSPNPVDDARFGYSIAITGSNVFISAPHECCYGGNASKKGKVYQFDLDGTWIRMFDHPDPTGVYGTTMGQSIGADGNILVIGDGMASIVGIPWASSGQIFVFDITSGSLSHVLWPPVLAHATRFGSVVAISGTNLVAGAFDALGGIGEAHLFDASTGVFLRTFANPSPDAGDGFGVHVAVDGNAVLIGASRDDTTASDGGAAYLFDAATGAVLQTFLDPTPATSGQFGFNVSIQGNRALIASSSFEYHLFDTDTGLLLRTITSSGCGQQSAVFGGKVLARCSHAPSGTVRAFDGQSGALVQTIANPTLTQDFFGSSIDAELDNLAIGARQADTAAVDGGAAYLYTLEGSDSDSDGDGVPDDEDMCPGGDDYIDTDMDGVADHCDPCPNDDENDVDGDGVCGDIDICFDGNDNDNADGDSLPDFCDACPLDPENDADGDGLCESDDNCATAANSDQADTDEDGAGDACDSDIDGDGVGNGDDNCVFDGNSDQVDTDGDGAGDACDTDLDGDGVLDADDACVPSSVGEVVNASGCGISSLCPCAHPDGGDKWKNHGAYVSCVARASEDFVAEGLMTEAEKDATVSAAGESSCGHKNQ